MAEYLNLDGLKNLWAKLKDTFAPKSHNHNASDINDGTLPIARGGTGATTWQNANEAILGGTAEEANDFGDDSQILCKYVSATSNKQRTYYRKTSRIWTYIKSKLGISSAVGSTTNPVYVDSNGQLKAVGGTMLKQGSCIDTHGEGSRTILIDGTNELFAFYDRGGTCTAYEYDLEWSSSSPAPAGTFSPADLSSHKTTASVAEISANVFNSLTGYNQSTVYSGTKYAVYDLKLPASFSHTTTFYWSFGSSRWKPHYFEVLVWKDNATQYPNGYISKYRNTSVDAYGSVSVGVGEAQGESFTHIRIVMDKYSRLAAFGIVNYSSTGLATNYMSRTVDRSLYRNITVAKNDTYNLGSSSAKWANVYATNFNGALKGNADTASNCNYSGKADANTLVVKRTNTSGGAFIQYLPNNQTENWWRTGSVQDSSKFLFNYKGTDKAFIDTNGVYNGDVKGNASTASAAKSGSALESAINGKQDALTAQTAYSAKGSATKVPKITTNALGQVTKIEEVTITQPDVSGKLDIDASNATSGTAEGIFNNSAERPDSDSYDISSSDVVLVQDVKNGAVGLPRRTTVERLLSNVNSNVRALANNKFDKENVVQNLNASNEDKVPSQKAVRNAVSSLDNSKQNKLPLDQDGETYNIHVQRSDIATAAQKDEDNNVIKTTYLKNENHDISINGMSNCAFIGACISITLGDDVSSTQMNAAAIVENRISFQYRHKCKTFHVLNLSPNDITVMGFEDGSTFKLLRNRGTTIYSFREGGNVYYYRMDL